MHSVRCFPKAAVTSHHAANTGFRPLKSTVFSKDLSSPPNALAAAIPGAEAVSILFPDRFFRISFDLSSISHIFAPPKKALLQ
jgi:hypothetical protein